MWYVFLFVIDPMVKGSKQPLVEGEVSDRPSITWVLFRILFFGRKDKKGPSFITRASLKKNP